MALAQSGGACPDVRHEAPRVHHADRRCGGYVAARGGRALAQMILDPL